MNPGTVSVSELVEQWELIKWLISTIHFLDFVRILLVQTNVHQGESRRGESLEMGPFRQYEYIPPKPFPVKQRAEILTWPAYEHAEKVSQLLLLWCHVQPWWNEWCCVNPSTKILTDCVNFLCFYRLCTKSRPGPLLTPTGSLCTCTLRVRDSTKIHAWSSSVW